MRYLIEKGADINAKTSNGVTLLHRGNKKILILQELLKSY